MNVENKTVEAQEIILKDAHGAVQGSLKAGDYGLTLSLGGKRCQVPFSHE
jgi:hypothetical protein